MSELTVYQLPSGLASILRSNNPTPLSETEALKWPRTRREYDKALIEALQLLHEMNFELAYRDNRNTELEAALKRIHGNYEIMMASKSADWHTHAHLEKEFFESVIAAAPLIEKVKS